MSHFMQANLSGVIVSFFIPRARYAKSRLAISGLDACGQLISIYAQPSVLSTHGIHSLSIMAATRSGVSLPSLTLLFLCISSTTASAVRRPQRYPYRVLAPREAAVTVLPTPVLSPVDTLLVDETHLLDALKSYFDHIRELIFPSTPSTSDIPSTSNPTTSEAWTPSSVPLSAIAPPSSGIVVIENITTTVINTLAPSAPLLTATSEPSFPPYD
ncbi:uncharacterized protein BDZ99DRAFT_48907 [Mytilinidion resinicola]|uniref:Uncharacterized protein n=1 Tax=Mytilinidion resinicola TaxID=574789 RepID=A0A6A6YH85_9PEZI|nr:uncharacterized protein BDZ99DRAFT_48907 [Mytilinidion resinicola]KAF2808182.1 hypothetical protein BDZ99DRAFT_48907 [Mytilinidion resinicola]